MTMSLNDSLVLSELQQMRAAQREDNSNLLTKVADLGEKLDDGFKAATKNASDTTLENERKFNHVDQRIRPLENVRRMVLWFLTTGIVAFAAALADFILNHRH